MPIPVNDSMSPQRAAEILGVSLNATEQEIRAAYRKLAKRWHPDQNPNNPTAHVMTQLIVEAYAVMKHYVKNRRPENNASPGQSQNHQPNSNTNYNSNNTNYNNNNSAKIQKAWQNLQDALRESEAAQADYDAAVANRDRAEAELYKAMDDQWKARFGTPEYKQKQEHTKRMQEACSNARRACLQASTRNMRAKLNVTRCEAEYSMLTAAGPGPSPSTRAYTKGPRQRSA